MKPRLSRLARDSRTLGVLNGAAFLLDRARSSRSNRRFVRQHPGFAVPPASLAFDAFGHTEYEKYFRTGIEHARFIADTARQYLPGQGIRVLEWGCGPARIVRHLPQALGGEAVLAVGVDFNPETIEWCERSISGPRFARNDLQPPLPFPDRCFDFVYAISVFTHLDEAGWSAWIRELYRVLADGGVLLFTTHGANYLRRLLADERALFTSGRPVFRAKTAEGKKLFVAYHPPEFVLASLPPGLQVLLHTESADVPSMAQDVWVLRKTSVAHPGPCPG